MLRSALTKVIAPVDAVGATVFLDGRILKFRDGFPNRLLYRNGTMNTYDNLNCAS